MGKKKMLNECNFRTCTLQAFRKTIELVQERAKLSLAQLRSDKFSMYSTLALLALVHGKVFGDLGSSSL